MMFGFELTYKDYLDLNINQRIGLKGLIVSELERKKYLFDSKNELLEIANLIAICSNPLHAADCVMKKMIMNN